MERIAGGKPELTHNKRGYYKPMFLGISGFTHVFPSRPRLLIMTYIVIGVKPPPMIIGKNIHMYGYRKYNHELITAIITLRSVN